MTQTTTRSTPQGMTVQEAVANRRSCRAFLPDRVPRQAIADLLAAAARTPSGSNLQPWRVHVLAGAARDRLVAAVRTASADQPRGNAPDHPIHPAPLSPAEEDRYQRAAALMYGAAGVERDDVAARIGHLARAWDFFGAPVGMIFTLERRHVPGQWAGVGAYMQTVMLLAESAGLGTCAQETWALWGDLVRQQLGLGDDQIIYSGLALGYPDHQAAINQFRSERAPLDEFATFHE